MRNFGRTVAEHIDIIISSINEYNLTIIIFVYLKLKLKRRSFDHHHDLFIHVQRCSYRYKYINYYTYDNFIKRYNIFSIIISSE